MRDLPIWSILPFVFTLLSVAILPAATPRFWNKYRVLILSTFAMPTLALSGAFSFHWVANAFADYVSFISLLGALFCIGAGLYISGAPKANPVTNLRTMALGALLGNLIGTLGASMLLIRPLLRSNRGRKHEVHVIVFFIFIVSNAGGLLTPLGDPPLFFGYLMGVPFFWSLKLFAVWFFALAALLGVFAALDSFFYIRDPDFRGPMPQAEKYEFHVIGRWNLALVPLVIGALLLPKFIPLAYHFWQTAARVTVLMGVIYLSRRVTPKIVDNLNHFSWDPFVEVAIVFAGIFATMIPAVKYFEIHAAEFGIATPWAFFWLSGIFSSLLDNAPTYAAFFSVAQGLGQDIFMITLSSGRSLSEPILMAISCGSVFFGAMTYIGNAPNLLIKALAEEEDIHMPSFFTYMIWSIGFLLPVLFLTAIFFFEN